MEETPLRFGALASADVKLWLMSSNEEDYEKNPICLHSVILKKSEFFEVKMSVRWSSDNSREIRVTTSHNFDDYLKCIELMYGEQVYFSNIQECLAILSVASELLVTECIKKCMEYLEAVRWSPEQETQIRDVLSSLGLKLLPDLASRLVREDDKDHMMFVEKIFNKMVSIIQNQYSSQINRETAEKHITGIFEGNRSRDTVQVCGRVLLQGFKSAVHSRELFRMSSLFQFIKRCDGEIIKEAFLVFCEDPKFTKCLRERYNKVRFDDFVFDTILWFAKTIGQGKIIISRASRVSFLTTWLPFMADLCGRRLYEHGELDKAVLSVVESLPLVDRKRSCVLWAEHYVLNHDIDISMPFALFKDLHDAHFELESKH